MRQIWENVSTAFSKGSKKSIRMQRKLFLYWSAMLLVVLSIFLLVLHITGVFWALDKEMQQMLSVRQKNVTTQALQSGSSIRLAQERENLLLHLEELEAWAQRDIWEPPFRDEYDEEDEEEI